jgi:hypothetical protein
VLSFVDLCLNFCVFAGFTVMPGDNDAALLYRFFQRRGQVAPIAAEERPQLCVDDGLRGCLAFF